MDRKKDFFIEASNEFLPGDAPYPKSRSHMLRSFKHQQKKSFSQVLKKEENRQADESGRDIKS